MYHQTGCFPSEPPRGWGHLMLVSEALRRPGKAAAQRRCSKKGLAQGEGSSGIWAGPQGRGSHAVYPREGSDDLCWDTEGCRL